MLEVFEKEEISNGRSSNIFVDFSKNKRGMLDTEYNFSVELKRNDSNLKIINQLRNHPGDYEFHRVDVQNVAQFKLKMTAK